MRTTYLVLLAAAALCLSGCDAVTTGPTKHTTQSIERDASQSLRAEFQIGAGTLKVSGGSPKWMEGSFDFNLPNSEPKVKYSSSGGHGELRIEQPASSGGVHLGNTINEWSVRLNNDIPTDLIAQFGAGTAEMELGSLSLHSVVVEMGAGKLQLDLRGSPKQSYDVRLRGGVGEATVYLPANVGVYTTANAGIGSINVNGLQKEGDHWINSAYGKAKVQVRLDVEGGVGTINVIAESPAI